MDIQAKVNPAFISNNFVCFYRPFILLFSKWQWADCDVIRFIREKCDVLIGLTVSY